jgi:hypothetical protein
VLKVNRIKTLLKLKQKATTDQAAHLRLLLDPNRFKYSWGIWVSDKPPKEVRLHFSAAVADRVEETLWHPTQKIERHLGPNSKPDGTVIWSALISEPLEMLPWIRGWGEDCKDIT